MPRPLKAAHRPGWLRVTAWLAVLTSVFAWAQLTYPGYFQLHSGFLPIFNLNNLMRHLGDLSWAPIIGQPYDLWRGEGRLPYLLAALPRLLGASSVTAVKLVFGASILVGAVGMYGWVRRRLGQWPGLLSAVAYTLLPMALATIYVRGAFAEAVLLGLMPWVLWAADVTLARGTALAAISSGLVLACAFWTQAGLALWLAASVLAYLLVAGTWALRDGTDVSDRTARTKCLLAALLSWLGGVFLGLLGLWPVIGSHGLKGDTWIVFGEHLVYPYQLLLAGWGVGPSIPGPDDTLSFQLGLVVCGLALVSVLASRVRAPDRDPGAQRMLRYTQWFAGCATLSLILLSTTLSSPLWTVMGLLARTLTYPWQLLLLTMPWLAWLAGLGGWTLEQHLPEEFRERGRPLLLTGLIALTVLGSYAYLDPLTTNLPVPDAPIAIFGEDEIALLSTESTGVPGPGGQVTVSVRWQALRPIARDYTVFFQALGPDGTLWGQQDIMPQGGAFPTSQWRPGQVVADEYQFTLKPDAPNTGDYRYLLGLYQWQTGERLQTGTDDKVVLSP